MTPTLHHQSNWEALSCWVVFFFAMPHMLQLTLEGKHASAFTVADTEAIRSDLWPHGTLAAMNISSGYCQTTRSSLEVGFPALYLGSRFRPNACSCEMMQISSNKSVWHGLGVEILVCFSELCLRHKTMFLSWWEGHATPNMHHKARGSHNVAGWEGHAPVCLRHIIAVLCRK